MAQFYLLVVHGWMCINTNWLILFIICIIFPAAPASITLVCLGQLQKICTKML